MSKIIGKREFIQNTSKYIKWVEEQESQLVITPDLLLIKIKAKSLKNMRGSVDIKVYGDINESILTLPELISPIFLQPSTQELF